MRLPLNRQLAVHVVCLDHPSPSTSGNQCTDAPPLCPIHLISTVHPDPRALAPRTCTKSISQSCRSRFQYLAGACQNSSNTGPVLPLPLFCALDVDGAAAAELWNFFKKSVNCCLSSGGANGCGCCSSGSKRARIHSAQTKQVAERTHKWQGEAWRQAGREARWQVSAGDSGQCLCTSLKHVQTYLRAIAASQ